MAAQFFRGTQLSQNVKFKDKDKQIIKSWQWPASFSQVFDLEKIQIDVLQPWIEKRCTQLMGNDDEIVISYIMSHLEQAKADKAALCPKQMQLYLTGFMEEKTSVFMDELVNLLIEARDSRNGVPPSLLKEKELELQRKKEIIEQAKLLNLKSSKWMDSGKKMKSDEEQKDQKSTQNEDNKSKARKRSPQRKDYCRSRSPRVSNRSRRDYSRSASSDRSRSNSQNHHRSTGTHRQKYTRRNERRDYRSRSRSPQREHHSSSSHRKEDRYYNQSKSYRHHESRRR